MVRSDATGAVLIVDDDANLRATIREYAETLGVDVWEASNGLEALWIVQHNRPSLVLLDLNMPRLGGFETVHHMRVVDPAIRIVILTGDRSEETQQRLTRLGLEVLLKPLAISDLDNVFQGPGSS